MTRLIGTIYYYNYTGFSNLLSRQLYFKLTLDGGYVGHYDAISTPNAHDSYGVKRFKSRALKRQEDFNGMTKTFKILRERFRHCVGRFPVAFEAVCVICQYKIESDEPLYDVLIEDILNEPAEDIYGEIGIAWA